jgi:predicted amidohydrolase YtcJ
VGTPADFAVIGASIRTLDPALPRAAAVAMRDGRIVAVGSDAEVREHCDGTTRVLDGHRMAIVPGLIDAHQHPVWGTELRRGADLAGLGTLEEVLRALERERERVGDDGWVLAFGLDYAVFGGAPLSHEPFAAVLRGAPALLITFDLHTGIASPRALEVADVDGPRSFPDASEVVCRDGVPTGELREPSAYGLVLDAVPAPAAAELRTAVARRLELQHAEGLTALHVMDGSPDTFALLDDMEADGQLRMRLLVSLWQRPGTPLEAMREHVALRDAGGLRWRGGVAKFFLDGVIDTGTAWLHDGDAFGTSGEPYWTDLAAYVEAVALFARAGVQCVTHAVGDRAVTTAVAAARAAGTHGSAPHRIEHLETLRDEDVATVAAGGVVASMQPLHMSARQADGSDSWAGHLRPEQLARAFRTRDLLDAGVPMALGSDWPVAPHDPRLGMAWARLRRRPGDPSAPQFEPEQALTGLEALLGYTTWAAAAGGDREAGRIAVGMRADLSAFAEDPVDCPADELPDLPVLLTVVDGEIVHHVDVC